MAKLRQQTERIGYPVLGVVSQLNALCRDKLGEYCHWGATTQDITDTATVLQIREALAIVEDDLAAISAGLADLARRHRDTPMIGAATSSRFPSPSATRWRACWPPWSGTRPAGPVAPARPGGRVRRRRRDAGLDRRGAMETQEGLMAELGLGQPVIAWHTVRDNIAEVGCFLGLVGGTLGKLSMDVKLMMQTESARFTSPTPMAGAPAAPCRRSATRSRAATSTPASRSSPARRRLDGRHGGGPRALDRTVGDRVDRPAEFCLLAGALKQARAVVSGLEVDAERMRANLDMTNGLVMSEAVMMGLGPIWAANTPMIWSMTSAARRCARTARCSTCWPRRPPSPST